MNFLRNKYAVSLTLAALIIGAAAGLRSLAQSANPVQSGTGPTNVMSGYVEAVREAIFSGTGATNLTQAEVSRLMNESIKTNLAAQLWFRQAMTGTMSAGGAKMAEEIRVLEMLREGRTDDAIRKLEDNLDGDIIVLADLFRASDETRAFKPTSQPLKALQSAKDYRLKFPHKTGDQGRDDRVAGGLSYVDKK